jgi:hypothetical protein
MVMFIYHYSSLVWGDVLFAVGIVFAVWLNLELSVPVVLGKNIQVSEIAVCLAVE